MYNKGTFGESVRSVDFIVKCEQCVYTIHRLVFVLPSGEMKMTYAAVFFLLGESVIIVINIHNETLWPTYYYPPHYPNRRALF